MPTEKCFADTNIAVYALDTDAAKREKALAILSARPVISTQVVNEYLNVLLTKRKLARTDVNQLARALMATCDVAAVTADVTELAMNIGGRYPISHWDSLIVAAALATGCDTLYCEDIQDGQVFEGEADGEESFFRSMTDFANRAVISSGKTKDSISQNYTVFLTQTSASCYERDICG